MSRYLLPLLVIGLFATTPASAQQAPPLSERGNSQIQYYARPGVPTITVNVWGSVGQPGLWRVEPDVDLVEFLSVVRVPGLGLDEPGTREENFVTIYRTVDGERKEIYKKELNAILEDGASYPKLEEKDVVAVTQKRRRSLGVQFFASVAGAASSIALLVLQLAGN